MKQCAFCDNEAVKRGGEHIWDDWLNKELPKRLYRARKRYTIDSPVIQYPTYKLDEQLPVVCETCNSGWMSALTKKIKDAFSSAMLKGSPFSLCARDAALLAAFTFMKAVVTNHGVDDDPFFTRGARERLRTSLVIPPLVKMWFAAYQGVSRFSTKNNLGIIGARESDPFYGMEFCSFSYVVGKLALQLLAPRWKDIRDRGKPVISINPNVYWQPAAIQFWPYGGQVLSWPPEKYLGDDVIEAFIYRFNMPINVPIS
jgi:hypothetical protein